MVPSLLAKRCGHECEQGEPERDEHTHIAQTVVAVQLVHKEDLKRHMNVRVKGAYILFVQTCVDMCTQKQVLCEKWRYAKSFDSCDYEIYNIIVNSLASLFSTTTNGVFTPVVRFIWSKCKKK